MTNEAYNLLSAATYLFWARIMKEHAIFIESSLPPTQSRLAAQAKQYHRQFARLFGDVIALCDGVLKSEMLASGQFYTVFTEAAEYDFEKFFGVAADIPLTVLQKHIKPYRADIVASRQLRDCFSAVGKRLLVQTEAFIIFQTNMLGERNLCKIFFGLYPSALNHLLREANRFTEELKKIEGAYRAQSESDIVFWNQGMSEHAKSLRGELDWTEESSFRAADYFALSFDALEAAAPDRAKSLEYTTKFGKYAEGVTRDFIDCRLKGIMSGLYCDHLYREVNHFEWLLERQPDL